MFVKVTEEWNLIIICQITHAVNVSCSKM